MMMRLRLSYTGRAFVLFLLLILAFAPTAFADQEKLGISASEPADDGTVTVTISYEGSAKIAGIQFAITYDDTMLGLVRTKNGSITKGGLSAVNDEQSGAVIYVWSALSAGKPSGDILILTFQIKDGASGTTGIEWNDSLIAPMLIDDELKDVACTRTGATIALGGQTTSMPGSPQPSLSARPTASQNPAASPGVNQTKGGRDTPAPAQDTDYSLEAGETLDLMGSAGIEAGKIYVWSSSNERVATVDENGVVTAHGSGETVISAIREDSSEVLEVSVSVSEPDAVDTQPPQSSSGEHAGSDSEGEIEIEAVEGVSDRSWIWLAAAGVAAIGAIGTVVYWLLRKSKRD